MEINKETLNHISSIANIILDEEKAKSMIKDLKSISNWINKISELETNKISPLIHMSVEENILREDVAVTPIKQQEALINAPEKDSNYFRVPSVIKPT